MREAHQFALASYDLYNALDLTDVAGYLEFDNAGTGLAVVVGGVGF